jgi:hypothetical protein
LAGNHVRCRCFVEQHRMMMQTFNNLYTGQSTTNCLPDNHSVT